MKYSIGIVTHSKRFYKYFIPLINSIKNHRNDIEVLVLVNGINNSKFDELYRTELLEFLSKKQNVYPQLFPEFRSLSKLWNSSLIMSSNDLVLILNDDVSVDATFFEKLESFIEKNKNLDIVTINSSWSHFLSNRLKINELGWFDERLLGIGNEDGDMRWRYLKKFNTLVPNTHIEGILNHSPSTNDLQNQKSGSNKYSYFNHIFINEKYKRDSSGLSDPVFWDGDKLVKVLEDHNLYPYEEFFWKRRSEL